MLEPKRILLMDDEAKTRKLIRNGFEGEGFEVLEAHNTDALFRIVKCVDIDMVLFDIRMRGQDGFAVIRRLRAMSDVPLMILNSRTDTLDCILGLELGADDFLGKPFDLREVIARVRAILRRRQATRCDASPAPGSSGLVRFDGWRIDPIRRELRRETGEEQPLTGAEFELLSLFVSHRNRVVKREQIINRLNGGIGSPDSRGVDMQVRRLRQKIEDDPSRPRIIRTVRGAGYLFASGPGEADQPFG